MEFVVRFNTFITCLFQYTVDITNGIHFRYCTVYYYAIRRHSETLRMFRQLIDVARKGKKII